MDKILYGVQAICGDSFIKWVEFSFVFIGIPFFLIMFPIVRHIEWKHDCKRYGKETAYEIWRRFR